MRTRTFLAVSATVALPLALLGAVPAQAAIPNPTITLDAFTDCTWSAAGTEICVEPEVPTVTLGSSILIDLPNNGFPRHSGAYSTDITTANGASQTLPAPYLEAYTDPNETLTVFIPSSFALSTDLGSNGGLDTIHSVWGEDGINVEVDLTLRVKLERAPSAPATVTGKRPSSTSATIVWQPPSDQGGASVSKYIVKRTSSAGSWSTSVSSATRSFTFNYLTPGSGYTLSVQAVNVAGNGSIAQVSVPGSTTALNASSAVTAKRTADTNATITWSAPTSLGGKSITGYRVTRDGYDAYGGGPYSKIVAATTRTFTMHYLVLDRTYALSVQPIYSGGTGPLAQASVFIG